MIIGTGSPLGAFGKGGPLAGKFPFLEASLRNFVETSAAIQSADKVNTSESIDTTLVLNSGKLARALTESALNGSGSGSTNSARYS